MRARVIPVLLLKGEGFYKTRKFKNEVYIGDPINALKIFNEKEVDEIVVLDIGICRTGSEPNYSKLKETVSECFMPLAYGGGIKSSEAVKKLLSIGIEKAIINTAAYEQPELINELVAKFGSSTIVGSIDVRKGRWGKYSVYIKGGTVKIPYTPKEWAVKLTKMGVGELIVTAIDHDGEMDGYDIELITLISNAVQVPVVANGGAASVQDFINAVKAGASAVAAGAMFVFHGKHRAVLIKYPNQQELTGVLIND